MSLLAKSLVQARAVHGKSGVEDTDDTYRTPRSDRFATGRSVNSSFINSQISEWARKKPEREGLVVVWLF
ncbi:hypothetical protein CLAFUW4_01017 [Fulvia fulva]|uniref:Uncharacterized protein n=1 Tax=Passalora fulva TaxID=5499 RepID=A0A9Q8L650_PASFU|nr:uncharacterized protein CLAFUR5_01023 [Fulvia fulva]KAK4634273.1 hypothetical protein CLAFUR4_01018 [Fulvia fulva]KAK4637080.1 hypothetical protein CLAFUR0_01019 [Fulvia fulva]UJO11524.1 hypothetical protein CLAFUR5_01023 [Fulvia fulva]WPV10224.1 hypothetical protein CLAFUW4_01017 [Fulvia fulva]WPV25305.1 hypothetical protein CLAFUW7_00799 [Fulvia fulva]